MPKPKNILERIDDFIDTNFSEDAVLKQLTPEQEALWKDNAGIDPASLQEALAVTVPITFGDSAPPVQPVEGDVIFGDEGSPSIFINGEWAPIPALAPPPIEQFPFPIHEGPVLDTNLSPSEFMDHFKPGTDHSTVIRALGAKVDEHAARIKELESMVMELAKKIGTQRFQQVIREIENATTDNEPGRDS